VDAPLSTDDTYDRLLEYRPERQRRSRRGRTKIYRMGSAAFRRDHVPFMVHFGRPGAKKTLCGWPRRFLEHTDTGVAAETWKNIGGPLPRCAACRNVANGGTDGNAGQLIARGRMGWFGRGRPIR
jgi:hypothetical protein